jgi:branched-subunit amino acid ABC-type transport system permease component
MSRRTGRLLNTLDDYNASHLAERADNSNLSARVASYELAFAFLILAVVILVRPRGLFTNARRTVFE